jgi:hypothetical protein
LLPQRNSLAVDLSKHNVDRPDDGDNIGEQAAFAHGLKRLKRCLGRLRM